MKKILACTLFIGLFSCAKQADKKFTLLSAGKTNVAFENTLSFDQDFNIYTYRNFYNGGGVGVGDFNNDGLNDLYFTANMLPNKLYLNKGNLQFEDVTATADVAGQKAWSTGVSLVDINADGWLDIYVCNSGDVQGDNKENELFINQQDGTFTEAAAAYGLADKGFSTHAAFFDYDRDGDLDCYVLNNSYKSIGSFNLQANERGVRDELGGDKLYRNDGGKFTDISEQAGIYGSEIGFGLGVTVGDINNDGWLDIFISNDFFERDYLYINNQDGTFTEELPKWMKSTSAASMGADMVDLNNDGHLDVFVTEMLPEGNERLKTKTTFESWDNYQFKLENDYYHQFTRNMLHLNTGNGKTVEISRFADVHATDWSWAALGADFDLDGTREIFVANGIYQDLTDQDYIMFVSSVEAMKMVRQGQKEDYQKLIDAIPVEPIPNYMFQKDSTLRYNNVADAWGLSKPSHSNGSAYADLDNDGDYDLVVNNTNAPAFIYRNNSVEHGNAQSFKIELKGMAQNPRAVGARVYLGENNSFVHEVMPIRGFQSTMGSEILVSKSLVKQTIQVRWPNGKFSTHDVEPNSNSISIDVNTITSFTDAPVETYPNSTNNTVQIELPFTHQENAYSDFDKSHLAYKMNSRLGPCVAVADLNNDKLDDFYFGGAKGQVGGIYIQQANGTFRLQEQPDLELSKKKEAVDAIFFDVDNDGDQDLYVVHGGSEFNEFSTELQDDLYTNENGRFVRSRQPYPSISKLSFGSCVTKADVNNDGFTDLFVGARQEGDYGLPSTSFLLINQKDGTLKPTEQAVLQNIGMVTDAEFVDLDKDGAQELVVVGEFMPVTIFEYVNGQLQAVDFDNENLYGWWNTVEVVNKDGDEYPDLLLGNHGLNSRFKAAANKPIKLYINDFDRNGGVEQIIACYIGDESYPMSLRHDLIAQIPYLKQQYLNYDDYKEATVEAIFVEEQLENSLVLNANELRNGFLLNNGSNYSFQPFSDVAQLSCVNAAASLGNEIFMGGNDDGIKPEVGRLDGSSGLRFSVDEAVSFQNDLGIEGVIQDIEILRTNAGMAVLFARNNDSPILLKLEE